MLTVDVYARLCFGPKSCYTLQLLDVLAFNFVKCNYLFVLFATQPRDILCGAADEVLVALKDDKLKVHKKFTLLHTGLLLTL